MRRVPALVAALLLALLGVAAGAGPASAHATLVSTDPAEGSVLAESPGEVTFTFDESVQLVPDGLMVFDHTGARIPADSNAGGPEVTGSFDDELTEGTYVVTLRVVSADGHPIAASLTFSVGAQSATVAAPDLTPPDPGALSEVQAVVHGLNYVGLLAAGGLLLFLARGLAGVRLAPATRGRLLRAARIAAGLAVLTAALAVPLSGAYQLGTGLDGLLDTAVLDPDLVTDDITVLLLQTLGLGLGLWAAGREQTGLTSDLMVALAVWSPALVGHTRAYEPSALLVLTDALHLSAGAAWLGGLVGLAIALPSIAGRPRDAAVVLTRFSTIAAGLLAAVAVTGLLLGWRIVGSWSNLFEQTYGRLLLAKVAIVLVVVAAAAWNRWRLVPAVTDGVGHDATRRAVGLVRRTVVAEAALVVAVLGVTGFLTQKPPGGASPAAPATADTGVTTATVDDLQVLAVVDPGPGLQRALIVQVQDGSGDPFDLYAAPSVALSSADVDLGSITLAPSGSGTYSADVVFPVDGAWEAQVALRVDEFTSPVVDLDLTVD